MIFTEDANYYGKVYKWKPPEHLTIDFLIVEPAKELASKEPYLTAPNKHIYLLFCGISYENFNKLGMELLPHYDKMISHDKKKHYFPIHFAPSGNKLAYIWETDHDDVAGHIGEFGYSDNGWVLHNLRPDKDILVKQGDSFGNDFRIAEGIFNSFADPLTFENLNGSIDIGYFQKSKTISGRYTKMIKFNSFVKAQVLRQLSGSNFVVDLAAGKGQDMATYFSFGVQHVLFVDIDKNAIIELDKRKFTLGQKGYHIYGKPPKDHKMQIDTLIADLTVDAVDAELATGVVINLALHYLIHNTKTRDAFIDRIDQLLAPGGTFIFTCFDGDRIIPLIKDDDFIIEEDNEIKYHISLVKKGKLGQMPTI